MSTFIIIFTEKLKTPSFSTATTEITIIGGENRHSHAAQYDEGLDHRITTEATTATIKSSDYVVGHNNRHYEIHSVSASITTTNTTTPNIPGNNGTNITGQTPDTQQNRISQTSHRSQQHSSPRNSPKSSPAMVIRSGGALRKATPPAVAPKPKRSVASLGSKSTSASSSLNNLSVGASRESLEQSPPSLHSSSLQVEVVAGNSAVLRASEEVRAQSLPVNSSVNNKNVVLMPMKTDMFYAPSHPMYSSDGLVALSAENLNKGQQQQQEQNRRVSTKNRTSNQQQLEQIGSRHMMTSSSHQSAHKRHSASVRSLPESVRHSRDQQHRSNNERPSYSRINSSTHTTSFDGDVTVGDVGSAATWDISLTKHKPVTRHKSTMV